MGFVDEDAVQALIEKVEKALRPLGVTLAMPPQAAYDPDSKALILQIVGLVGDSAFEKLGQTDESKVAKREMQEQLKDQKDARMTSMVDSAKGEIEAMMRGEDIFTDALERPCPESEDGKHSLHPVDGFCVLCHAGM